jgi:hypothetical protein
MKELMRALYTQINNAHSYKTYRTEAPEKVKLPDGREVPTPFPYVVYKLLPIQNTEKDRDDYALEVSCWDKSESDLRVMELAESIRTDLVNFRHLDEHNLIIVTRPNVGYIPDSDAEIKRYDVTATLLTYRR